MRTPQELKNIVESAFTPLHCEAEVHYDREFRFCVFAPDGREVILQPLMVVHPLLDNAELRRFVLHKRAEVEAHGFKLDPWQLVT